MVGAITCFGFYWVDKVLFCYLYGKPPQYDPSINKAYTNILAWSLVLHVAFGTWMLGNKYILRSDESGKVEAAELASEDTAADMWHVQSGRTVASAVGLGGLSSHLLQSHVAPMFSLLVVLLAAVALKLAWTILGGITAKLFRFLTCGRCCVAETVFLKDDYEKMKPFIKLWGIPSYNIFQNPLYQMLFSVDDKFAERHRHVEDLGDISELRTKSVELILRGGSKKEGKVSV